MVCGTATIAKLHLIEERYGLENLQNTCAKLRNLRLMGYELQNREFSKFILNNPKRFLCIQFYHFCWQWLLPLYS